MSCFPPETLVGTETGLRPMSQVGAASGSGPAISRQAPGDCARSSAVTMRTTMARR